MKTVRVLDNKDVEAALAEKFGGKVVRRKDGMGESWWEVEKDDAVTLEIPQAFKSRVTYMQLPIYVGGTAWHAESFSETMERFIVKADNPPWGVDVSPEIAKAEPPKPRYRKATIRRKSSCDEWTECVEIAFDERE